MILTPDQYQKKIEPLVSQATKIYIVSAWVTKNYFLDCLYAEWGRPKLKIKTIAGTKNNISDPDALEMMDEMGKLSIGDRLTTRTYHPKVYMFENETSSVMWIGSANFTSGGFPGIGCSGNYEVLYEVRRKGTSSGWKSWFDELWDMCEPATDAWLKEYRKERKRNPPKNNSTAAIGEPSPLELIDMVHLGKILDVMGEYGADKVKIGYSKDGKFKKGEKGAQPNYQIIRSSNGEEIAISRNDHKRNPRADEGYEETRLVGPFSISDVENALQNLRIDLESEG